MEFEGRSITGADLPALIDELRVRRQKIRATSRQSSNNRVALTKTQRSQILEKTDSRCHICGGLIEGRWNADHVFPRASGGAHSVDNYLPAHPGCNTYRWDYTPDEYQLILKLGVWLKGEIMRETRIGMDAADKFVKGQVAVTKRRRRKVTKANEV